jgi:hypothetical protein
MRSAGNIFEKEGTKLDVPDGESDCPETDGESGVVEKIAAAREVIDDHGKGEDVPAKAETP